MEEFIEEIGILRKAWWAKKENFTGQMDQVIKPILNLENFIWQEHIQIRAAINVCYIIKMD